jgi:hypothetical protein
VSPDMTVWTVNQNPAVFSMLIIGMLMSSSQIPAPGCTIALVVNTLKGNVNAAVSFFRIAIVSP